MCTVRQTSTVFPYLGSQVLKLISVLERSEVFCNCVTNITFIVVTRQDHINALLYFFTVEMNHLPIFKSRCKNHNGIWEYWNHELQCSLSFIHIKIENCYQLVTVDAYTESCHLGTQCTLKLPASRLHRNYFHFTHEASFRKVVLNDLLLYGSSV